MKLNLKKVVFFPFLIAISYLTQYFFPEKVETFFLLYNFILF